MGMIRNHKKKEPKAWKAYRETSGVSYSPIPELRNALLKEQGCICAYCMREVPVKDETLLETSKIEHLKSRENFPNLQLDYNNMVICCPGFINGDEHCDKSKKSQALTFSPIEPYFFKTVSYSSKDAAIKSSNEDWDAEINDILCLNNAMLKANRNETLAGVRMVLENKKWKKSELEAKLEEWMNFDKNGKMKPYCGIVIWYLAKKIKQMY
jgi:uncharacterized protein (TIGR02646 family)